MGLRVGVVRDERYLDHKPGHTHPEHPRRLRAVYRMLDEDFPGGLMRLGPELASLEQLERVHSSAYIERVLKTSEHDFTSLAPDTPASAKTYLAAWLAVGGCVKGLEALMAGECEACFSLVRPPGHHALPDRAGGFCIFNNLGITARIAMGVYGLERILLVDWDVHHGNGLNNLFYEEKKVLYFSSHDPHLYPYSGGWEDTGRGEGEGYTVNIPLPRELEDEEWLYIYREVLGPMVRRYAPQLILVDAGFDGHHDDPIGRSRFTEKAYGWLTRLFLDLREEVDKPPLLLALEGGYNPRALAGCVREVLMVLTGKAERENLPAGETERSRNMVKRLRAIHGKHGVWVDKGRQERKAITEDL